MLNHLPIILDIIEEIFKILKEYIRIRYITKENSDLKYGNKFDYAYIYGM